MQRTYDSDYEVSVSSSPLRFSRENSEFYLILDLPASVFERRIAWVNRRPASDATKFCEQGARYCDGFQKVPKAMIAILMAQPASVYQKFSQAHIGGGIGFDTSSWLLVDRSRRISDPFLRGHQKGGTEFIGGFGAATTFCQPRS